MASQAYQFIDGTGVNGAPQLDRAVAPKDDTKVRRTLITAYPEFVAGFDVWAIERSRRDLADRIASTNPWPKAPIVGSLLADWCDPLVLLTVYQSVDAKPYEVYQFHPAIRGRVPFAMVPGKFEETWLEGDRGRRWRPGQPRPAWA